MTVFNPRKRIVSLRLSDAEYKHLVDLCTAHDAHSVSDLARIAVCGFLSSNGNGQNHRLSGSDLQAKVIRLEAELQRLSGQLDLRASSASAGGEG
jgi:hypothetical protein